MEGKTPLDLLNNEYTQKEEDSQSQKSQMNKSLFNDL